jgi:drug/metabolite transporter (DMT)-like permease
MLIVGLFCSYIAAVLWNAMSQRVPTAIVGPMLVFETFFSVTFSLIYEKSWPSVTLICGMALLMGGVVYTLRMFEKLVQNDAGGSA